LSEWHLAPEYIFANWTDEEFSLMCEKLSDRKKREAEAWNGKGKKKPTVSDEQLFSQANNLIKVVKKD